MQFIVIGKDGTDSEALQRRLAARDEHLKLGDEGVAKGNFIMGSALLNHEGQMCGSVMLVDFDTREELDQWLKVEPYVTGDVWREIEVFPAKLGPSFEHILKS